MTRSRPHRIDGAVVCTSVAVDPEVAQPFSLALQRGSHLLVVTGEGDRDRRLLECFGGRRRPYGGEIRIYGAASASDDARSITGLVTSQTSFLPTLSLGDHGRIVGKVGRSGFEEADFFEILDRFGRRDLDGYLTGTWEWSDEDVFLGTLALSFGRRPRLLILDRPSETLGSANLAVVDEIVDELVKDGGIVIESGRRKRASAGHDISTLMLDSR